MPVTPEAPRRSGAANSSVCFVAGGLLLLAGLGPAAPAAAQPADVIVGSAPKSKAPAAGRRPEPARPVGKAAAPLIGQPAPKLVLLLVVDQFRADTLTRFAPLLGEGGFRRLAREGAFAIGRYSQQNTYTGPGHAVIATGSYGYQNGITQNKFWNRATNRSEAMMFDAGATVLSEKPEGPEDETSPRNLLGSTFGDELRLVNKDARVVAVALKGRGALLLGGHLGSAYFFSDQTGQMTTSTYYAKDPGALPEWVRAWNQRKLADAAFGTRWERMLPAERYTGLDDSRFEMDTKGLGRAFPHPLTGKLDKPGPAFYEALTHTPVGLDLTLSFARAALEGEKLGQRGVPDVLAVSFSSTDLAGHLYGPDSHEYQDMVLRLDRALAELLGELDRRFRPGELLVALTADHGAVPIPEEVAARQILAGRIKKAVLREAVNKALGERFKLQGDWVVALEDPSLYLSEKLLQQSGADPQLVEDTAARALLSVPGVVAAYTRTQLLRGLLPPTPAAQAVARSYFPPRGGDVVVVTAPFYFWGKYGEKDQGTSHGSFYRYDTDVPVFFLGPWFQPGEHGMIDMSEFAATLSHVTRVTPPAACEGQPLLRLLKPR